MGLILYPFAIIFQIIVFLRRWFYESELFSSVNLNKPVISVGNITLGGTGKTPFVDFLISHLEAKNLKVGVLTRGYGRKSEDIIEVSSNSKTEDVGDEPLWLKKRHPQSQIVVGKDRVLASKKLKDRDVIILDDGMQHFKIKRNLDIALVDVTVKKNDYLPLPSGKAREFFYNLERMDMVILTKTNLVDPRKVDYMADKVFKTGVMEVLESQLTVVKCAELLSEKEINISGKKCFLVSGIANPESFEAITKETGAKIVFHHVLPDHTSVVFREIDDFVRKAILKKADIILITEKDAVKWKEVVKSDLGLPICVLYTQISFNTEVPSFYDLATYNFS